MAQCGQDGRREHSGEMAQGLGWRCCKEMLTRRSRKKRCWRLDSGCFEGMLLLEILYTWFCEISALLYVLLENVLGIISYRARLIKLVKLANLASAARAETDVGCYTAFLTFFTLSYVSSLMFAAPHT